MKRFQWIAALVLIAPCTSSAIDTVVVCPSELREALGPWVKYRAAQGHRIELVPSNSSPTKIRHRIRQVVAAARQIGAEVKTVVLVGDVPSAAAGANVNGVPAHQVKAKVITKYGGGRQFASDNSYADLDDDHVPDLALGRLPADSPAELAAIIEKIVAYETNPDFGLWRRNINLVAGVGGFGVLIDSVIESTTKMFLTSGIPAGYRTTMTQASWTSPYCPAPPRFSATAIERINEGCLFWVYIGHGNQRTLDSLRVPGGVFPILTAGDVPQIKCERSPPVALFFSCYAGAFAAREDCLAEELLRRKSGPVAVIAGSNVTTPYAMAILGSGMLTEFFEKRRGTLGEIFLRAKRRLADDSLSDSRRQMLDTLAALMTGSKHNLVDERFEHLHLFNLIGDPLLRIRHPRAIKIKAPAKATAGSEITIDVEGGFPGMAAVELKLRRDRLAFKPKPRIRYAADEKSLAEYDETYRRANDRRLANADLLVDAAAFKTRLRVPVGTEGACRICVFVRGKDDFAIGSAEIIIQEAE